MSNADYIADKAIYVDADGKVVDENDPKKLTKIADVGARVSDEDVQKYGLDKLKTKPPVDMNPESDEDSKKKASKSKRQ